MQQIALEGLLDFKGGPPIYLFLYEADGKSYEKECATFDDLYHLEHILSTSQFLGIKMSTRQLRIRLIIHFCLAYNRDAN